MNSLNQNTRSIINNSKKFSNKSIHNNGWIPGNERASMYLDVPYSEKNHAKSKGARWDGEKLKWYVPHGFDIHPFSQWWQKVLNNKMQSFDKH